MKLSKRLVGIGNSPAHLRQSYVCALHPFRFVWHYPRNGTRTQNIYHARAAINNISVPTNPMGFNACDFPIFLSTSIFSIHFILIPNFLWFLCEFPKGNFRALIRFRFNSHKWTRNGIVCEKVAENFRWQFVKSANINALDFEKIRKNIANAKWPRVMNFIKGKRFLEATAELI